MRRHRFRQLVAATVTLAFGLVLLGVYTAAVGAGLTCDGRWPLCDGWLGLFPAHWPSFVEWFHRLVAMVTGFFILGTAAAAWRGDWGRRVRVATAVAVVLLPVQIWLGAQTVLTYTFLSRTAHFSTALAIFAGLVLTAVWVAGPGVADRDRVRRGLLGVAALHLPLVAFGPGGPVAHTATVQVAYYAVGLLAFGGFVVAAAWAVDHRDGDVPGRVRSVAAVAAVAAVLVGVQLLLGRLVYTDLVALVDVGAGVVTFALALVAARLVGRSEARSAPRADVAGD